MATSKTALRFTRGARGILSILGERTEHATVRCVAKPAVTAIVRELTLPIPNRLGLGNPSPALVIRGYQDEQIVKFVEGSANSAMIVRFTPIGESLLRGLNEFQPGLEELRGHNECGAQRRLGEPM